MTPKLIETLELASDFQETEVGLRTEEYAMPDDYRDYTSPHIRVAEKRGKPEILEDCKDYTRRAILFMSPTKRIKILYNSEGENKTDGKSVYVSTDSFGSTSDIGLPLAHDATIGAGVHECAHLMYTDFKMFNPKDIRARYPDVHTGVLLNLNNMVEDVRIEKNIRDNYWYQFRYISALNSYLFDYKVKKKMEALASAVGSSSVTSVIPLQRFQLMMKTVMQLLYPVMDYTDAEYEEMADFIPEVVKILSPFPDTSRGSFDAAYHIYQLLDKEVQDAQKNGGDESEGSGDGSEEDVKNLKELLDEANHAVRQALEDLIKALISPSDEESEDKPDITSIENIDTEYRGGYDEVDKDRELQGLFFKAPSNSEAYDNIKVDIMPHVSAMAASLRPLTYDFVKTQRGQRQGRLDTGKFVDAKVGLENIYMNRMRHQSDKLALVVLIDESGSMHGNEIQQAQRTAILLHEAFKNNPDIDLYIYGHTADHTPSDNIYSSYGKKEFDELTSIIIYDEPGMRKPTALGSVRARANNRDGVAMRLVCRRVRSQTKRRGLFFVISDGAPSAMGYRDGVLDTRKAAIEISHQDFYVAQIAIGSHVPSAEMFQNYVTFEDVSKLPQGVLNLTRTMLIKH